MYSNGNTNLHTPVRQAALGGGGGEDAPADTGLLPAFVKSFVMVRRPWCTAPVWLPVTCF